MTGTNSSSTMWTFSPPIPNALTAARRGWPSVGAGHAISSVGTNTGTRCQSTCRFSCPQMRGRHDAHVWIARTALTSPANPAASKRVSDVRLHAADGDLVPAGSRGPSTSVSAAISVASPRCGRSGVGLDVLQAFDRHPGAVGPADGLDLALLSSAPRDSFRARRKKSPTGNDGEDRVAVGHGPIQASSAARPHSPRRRPGRRRLRRRGTTAWP